MHRPLIQASRKLRKQSTKHEIKLWRFLRNTRFENFKFRRQHPLGPYIVDFYCPQKRLVIELDGGGHDQIIQNQKDKTRDQYFKWNGYKIIRIWNSDLDRNLEGVQAIILQTLESPLTPALSPPGGEGD